MGKTIGEGPPGAWGKVEVMGVVGDTSLSPEEYVGEYVWRRDCWCDCEPESAREEGKGKVEGESESSDWRDCEPETEGEGEGESEFKGGDESVGDPGGDNGRDEDDPGVDTST